MSTTQDTTTTVNGTALTSLNAVKEAFSYMTKDYNNADLINHGDKITIVSRYTSHLEHFEQIRDSVHIEMTNVHVRDGKPAVTVREL